MRMYGKNEPSDGKMRAFEQFKNGEDYKEIAASLRVREATAEVYTIGALAAGAPLDHARMANLLGITGEMFDRIRAVISSNTDSKLRTIREELNESFSYNQIRFVLACMIRALDV